MTDDDKREPVEERWIYGGIREFDGVPHHGWIVNEEKGDRRYWERRKLKGTFVVGGYYAAMVVRFEGDRVSLRGTPRYTGERVDRDLGSILWAEDHAAKSRLAALALERKHAKENPVSDALRPLMRIAAKLQVGTEQDAFIMYVERQLRRAMYLPQEKW